MLRSTQTLMSLSEQDAVMQAIGEAEKITSGEIRVFIDRANKTDALERAAFIFEKIGMHKTVQRNGVLIYLSIKTHQFAIIGDMGINKVVAPDYWHSLKDAAINHFKKGAFAEGLCSTIRVVANTLAAHFPGTADNHNELPDNIVFGK